VKILTNVEAFGHPRQIPYGLNSDLSDSDLARITDANLAVNLDPTLFHTILHLWHLHVCTRDGNGGTNLNIVLVHGLLEKPRGKMTVWIHGYNLLLVAPLWERANLRSRFGIGEIWLVCNVEVLACYSEGVVYGIGTSMSTDSY
jgi:hypothetical protein